MRFNKPPLTIEDQISLLKKRGLKFQNDEFAINFLSRISYYRFSAYLLPFQIKDGTHCFKQNSTFEKAVETYLFDRDLRLIIFGAIEKIEIAVRARLINIYSLPHGGYWYTKKEIFYDLTRHSNSLHLLKNEIKKSNEVFLRHYYEKYNDPELPPAWMALEIMSFGNLSKLFKNLKNGKEKDSISHSFDLPVVLFSSWLELLTYVRNICAHHSRLWNRELTLKPKLPKKVTKPWLSIPSTDEGRIYVLLAILHYLLRSINDDQKLYIDIKHLIGTYSSIPLNPMGFPVNWGEDPFWLKI